MESEGLLVLVEELSLGGAAGQVPERKDGKEDGEGTLDDEEVAPLVEAGLDMEDAVRKETALLIVSVSFPLKGRKLSTHKSVGNVGGRVEGG